MKPADDVNQNIKTNEEGDDYPFISEVIKKPPFRVRKGALRLLFLLLAAGAVIAGACAAFLLPRKKSSAEIEDEVHLVPESEAAEDIGEVSLSEIIENARKAVVTVAVIPENTEPSDADFEEGRYESSFGVFFAETSEQVFVLSDADITYTEGQLYIMTADGFSAKAEKNGRDPGTGLAVLSVSRSDLPQEEQDLIRIPEPGDSSRLRKGDSVIAIGSPLGYIGSVARGEILDTEQKIFVTDGEYPLCITDIHGGEDAGGVLLNKNGKIVCIFMNNADGEDLSGIPLHALKEILEDMCSGKPLRFAGITGITVTERLSSFRGVPEGIYIEGIEPESPALQAGLAIGDVITEADGEKAPDMERFGEILRSCAEGDTLKITALREGSSGYVEFRFELVVGVQP